MRIGCSSIIVIVLCLLSSHALSITRDEVVYAAQSEADYSYASCSSTDTTGIMNNVYHSNYGLAGVYGCSPEATILYEEWPFYNGWPEQHTWSGAPYCYGGTRMGSTCQDFINAGNGVGATDCQYAAIGETNSWAAGIDCSHFVCRCLGIGFNDTRSLPSQCESVSWNQLQKGDLLIWPGHHVMMFKEWEDPDKVYYTVIHASQGGKRVWKQTGRGKDADMTLYSPYTPNVIAGDPAACVAGFRVEYGDGILKLIWETECERDTRAFWVERSVNRDGPWERISEPIQGRGSDTSGAEYSLVDSSYPGGQIYYRLIEQENGWRTMVKAIATVESGSTIRRL